jgi:hypothetical protein
MTIGHEVNKLAHYLDLMTSHDVYGPINVYHKFIDKLSSLLRKHLNSIPDKGAAEFQHYKGSMGSINLVGKVEGSYEGIKEIVLFDYSRKPIKEHNKNSILLTPMNTAELIESIRRNPYIKGVLVDLRNGVPLKFRIEKTRVSCDDLFWKKFDRSKLGGRAADFKEFLWDEIYDCYINHDNPKTDPIYAKRKEILRNLSPFFRVVNLNDREGWKPVLIDNLPDPTMGRPLSLDTLKNYIKKLKK